MKVVAAVLNSWRQADQARVALAEAGIDSGDLRFVAGDPCHAYKAAPETGVEIVAGEVAGVTAGGVVGGFLGWLLDILELASAEIELLLASGPLEAAFEVVDPTLAAGASVGAFAGGLLGVHAGWSRAEGRARAYRARVAEGEIMILIKVPDRRAAQLARATLRRVGAQQITSGLVR